MALLNDQRGNGMPANMDSSDLVNVVRNFSTLVRNGRTLHTTLDHLRSEVDELQAEVDGAGGEDGVIGEAIDVIACALDMIFQYSPEISNEELGEIMLNKCVKWANKYS